MGATSIQDFRNDKLSSGLSKTKNNVDTLLYLSDITNFVEEKYNIDQRPVSSKDILVFLLEKNGGKLERAIWDQALFFKFASRNFNAEGKYDPIGSTTWFSKHIRDEYTLWGENYNESLTTLPQACWNNGCDKNNDQTSRIGIAYHMWYSAALNNSLPSEIVQLVTAGTEFPKQEEHGTQKVSDEMFGFRRIQETRRILEQNEIEQAETLDRGETEKHAPVAFLNVQYTDDDIQKLLISNARRSIDGNYELSDGTLLIPYTKTSRFTVRNEYIAVIPKELVGYKEQIISNGVGSFKIDNQEFEISGEFSDKRITGENLTSLLGLKETQIKFITEQIKSGKISPVVVQKIKDNQIKPLSASFQETRDIVDLDQYIRSEQIILPDGTKSNIESLSTLRNFVPVYDQEGNMLIIIALNHNGEIIPTTNTIGSTSRFSIIKVSPNVIDILNSDGEKKE